MNRKNIGTYAIIGALILLSGFASIIGGAVGNPLDLFGGGPPPAPDIHIEPEPEIITLDVEDYLIGKDLMAMPVIGPPLTELNGQEVQLPVLIGILTAVFVGITVGMGAPLYLIYSRLDDMTTETKQDETYQKSVAALEAAEKDFIKQNKTDRPADEKPSHELPRWTVVSTSLIYILFAMTVGAMISDSIVPSGQIVTENDTLLNPVSLYAYGAGLFALILCAIYFRPSGIMAYEKSDYRATNWGLIWVVLSGVVFVGAGIGMMVAVRSMGG